LPDAPRSDRILAHVHELLANAARYAGGYACLELGVIDGFVTISLHDAAAEFTLEIRRPADELAESGRGLFLVSQLARKISVIPMNGAGKCVRVVLDLRPATMGLSEPTCGRRWLRHEDGICMGPRIAKYYPEMTRRRDE